MDRRKVGPSLPSTGTSHARTLSREHMLVACIALALALRFAWQIRVGFYERPETWEYDDIARSLVAGRGYVYHFLGTDWHTFSASPVYPVLLAMLHLVGEVSNAYLLVGIVQACLSAALVLPTYAIARQLDGAVSAIAAAIIVAVHPGLIVYSAKVHELTLDTLLAAVFVAALLRAARAPTVGAGGIVGIAGGLAALARPTIASFAVLGLAALALRGRWRGALLAMAITVAFAVSWTVRNALILGPGAPLSPYNCVTIWMGNNPSASGSTLGLDGRSVFLSMPDDMRVTIVGRPEQEQGRVFCAEAAHWLSADPVRSLGWWTLKFWYFWWFSPYSGLFYPPGWLDLYRSAYAAEALLAALGVLVIWGTGWRLGLLFVGIELLTLSLAQSLAYVEGRHRLLLEPSIASLSGAGFVAVLRSLRWPTIARVG